MKISLRNRWGFFLISIGKFFCRQGEKFLSTKSKLGIQETRKSLAQDEENSVPCPIDHLLEEAKREMQRIAFIEQSAGNFWSQPICGSAGSVEQILSGTDPERQQDGTDMPSSSGTNPLDDFTKGGWE